MNFIDLNRGMKKRSSQIKAQLMQLRKEPTPESSSMMRGRGKYF